MSEALSAVPEITPAELVVAIERGEALQIVDVRNPLRVAGGRIDLVPDGRFHNIVGSQLRARSSLEGTGIAADLPIVTVCGFGNDSRAVGAHFRSLGLDARSLRGGMAAYMDTLIERPLDAPAGFDRVIQFDRIGKGALGYLLVSDGEALIVDPPRDPSAMLAAVRAAGARLVAVADTHVHADYVSGAAALARAHGVPYRLHPADAFDPFDGTPGKLALAPLANGVALALGRATLTALHTPGHTEGSTTLLAGDALALTGDFVFVESIGRPDLAGRADAWSEQLWASLERAKRDWPANLLVLPGHYSSGRERRGDRSIAAPWGALLRDNAALAMTDRAAFLAWARTPSAAPAAYRTIKRVNVGLVAVTPDEAIELEVGRNECAMRT
ncbi:MAG TPA: MBL fold metallo-hydrolase [Candidatus Acidoferrales bacterium]|nr:MBL fold metallo-hydrolase [Candidatus Acidoferrales bacterium]